MRMHVAVLVTGALGVASAGCVGRVGEDSDPGVRAGSVGAEAPPTVAGPVVVAFDAELRPLLEARCGRCHFPGGKMHARLPFDDEATVRTLGAEKLFTRIEDEEGRSVVNAYFKAAADVPDTR